MLGMRFSRIGWIHDAKHLFRDREFIIQSQIQLEQVHRGSPRIPNCHPSVCAQTGGRNYGSLLPNC
jgi:hypothetical protein